MNFKNSLWVEKYRPQCIDDLVLPENIKDLFRKGINQNFLFCGSAGTGKSSTVKSLINEFKLPYIFINGSSERGLETIRDTITNFAINQTLNATTQSPIKVVWIDEIDGFTDLAFNALRSTMERFLNIRFICTCNYVEKIPDAIQSRFSKIDFNFNEKNKKDLMKGMILRIQNIVKQEDCDMCVEAIAKLVNQCFPDLRSAINRLQRLASESKEISIEMVDSSQLIDSDELFDLVINKNNVIDNFTFLISKYKDIPSTINILGVPFVKYIMKSQPNLVKFIPQITILNAKYQSEIKWVVDQSIVLLALVSELQQLIQK